jgi:hypothetical protein
VLEVRAIVLRSFHLSLTLSSNKERAQKVMSCLEAAPLLYLVAGVLLGARDEVFGLN